MQQGESHAAKSSAGSGRAGSADCALGRHAAIGIYSSRHDRGRAAVCMGIGVQPMGQPPNARKATISLPVVYWQAEWQARARTAVAGTVPSAMCAMQMPLRRGGSEQGLAPCRTAPRALEAPLLPYFGGFFAGVALCADQLRAAMWYCVSGAGELGSTARCCSAG